MSQYLHIQYQVRVQHRILNVDYSLLLGALRFKVVVCGL